MGLRERHKADRTGRILEAASTLFRYGRERWRRAHVGSADAHVAYALLRGRDRVCVEARMDRRIGVPVARCGVRLVGEQARGLDPPHRWTPITAYRFVHMGVGAAEAYAQPLVFRWIRSLFQSEAAMMLRLL